MQSGKKIGLFKRKITAIHTDHKQYRYDVRDTASAAAERRERALREERQAILELQLELDEHPPAPPEEGPPEKKKLKRELEREALARLEDAARTPEQFQNVIDWWDRLDRTRERRERYYEISRSGDTVPLDYGATRDNLAIPGTLNGVLTKQIRKGYFLDAIFNCPFEISELVTDEYISKILDGLKDTQKEVLFLRDVCQYSTKRIGQIRGQSDRNIRKVHAATIRKIDKMLIPILHKLAADGEPLTAWERRLLEESSKT